MEFSFRYILYKHNHLENNALGHFNFDQELGIQMFSIFDITNGKKRENYGHKL